MLTEPMQIRRMFPVRKSRDQKLRFREAVQSYVMELGYDYREEDVRCGGKNLVIGDPDHAQYLITAHYDTPAAMILPNMITPCNPVFYFLYQMLIVGLYLAVCFGVGYGVFLLSENRSLAFLVGYFLYLALFALMLLGPANKNNANDNTSGVVTLLETARTMPENLRPHVCFVLFDLEEAGLIGSSGYRKAHKAATETQLILNLDCVGDGSEIVFFPTKKLRQDPKRLEELRVIVGSYGKKRISIRDKGYAHYPSDQRNFPYGVGIAALRRHKILGLYCSRIHTKKDTVLDPSNVNILRAALTTVVGSQLTKKG